MRLLAPIAICLAPVLAAQGVPAVAADRDLLSVVPPDAYVVVVTDRLDAIRERSAQNAWARFLSDERIGVTDALGRSIEADEGTRGALEAWRGIEGEIVAFLAPPEKSGGVLIRAGAGLGAVRALSDRLIAEKLQGEGAALTEAAHAGVALRVLELGLDDDACALFEIGDVAGMTFGEGAPAALALAHRAIDAALAPSAPQGFAADPGFVGARASGLARPAITLHLRLQELMVAHDEDWSQPDWESEDDRRAVRAIGLDRLRWIHAEADLGAGERLDLSVRVHMPEGTFLDALSAAFGPLPIDMLGRLPGAANGVTLAGFDVPAIWSAVRRLAHDLGPEAEAEFEQGLADAETEIGASASELVAMLSGKIAGFQMAVPVEEVPELGLLGEDVDPSMANGSAYLIAVPDADPVRELVAGLIARSGMEGMVEETTVAGHPTAVISFGGMFEARWAFLDDALAFGQQPTPFRTLLKRTGRTDGSAAENPAFTREARAYPEALYLSVSETARSVRSLLAMSQWFSMMFGMGMPYDLALLKSPPDPELANEFFRGTMTFATRRRGDALEIVFAMR